MKNIISNSFKFILEVVLSFSQDFMIVVKDCLDFYVEFNHRIHKVFHIDILAIENKLYLLLRYFPFVFRLL